MTILEREVHMQVHMQVHRAWWLVSVVVGGCPGPWPDIVSCEDLDACSTAAASTGGMQSTSAGVQTVTGDAGGGSTTDASTGETTGSTGASVLLPVIVEAEATPKVVQQHAVIEVTAIVEHADAVSMTVDGGEATSLTWLRPGKFGAEVPAFTGLANGLHTAVVTPWREALAGEPVAVEYTIALPPPGHEAAWRPGDDGQVAALAVLPDGRPVEFGTDFKLGVDQPRCYLRLRALDGQTIEVADVLAPQVCRAVDLRVDPVSGVMHVLVERESQNGVVWWVGESSGWGEAPVTRGTGENGERGLALASRPGLVAVCGQTEVATPDGFDAMAVLLRPGEAAERRRFDYEGPNGGKGESFRETGQDCVLADDTKLVMTGWVRGEHDGIKKERDRLMLLEHEVAADTATWTVAGPGPGVQTRGLAVDVDDEGFYHVAGYHCLDVCAPEGLIRVIAPGGGLEGQVVLGPLGSELFGPHDLAWSPAGYAVVALGGLQGQTAVFKVQAFMLDEPEPVWTFVAKDQGGIQLAVAVAVGQFGEVYAGGVGPNFAVIGG
jgi:hypothetical protein